MSGTTYIDVEHWDKAFDEMLAKKSDTKVRPNEKEAAFIALAIKRQGAGEDVSIHSAWNLALELGVTTISKNTWYRWFEEARA